MDRALPPLRPVAPNELVGARRGVYHAADSWLVWSDGPALVGMGGWATLAAPAMATAIAVWDTVFARTERDVTVLTDIFDLAQLPAESFARLAHYFAAHVNDSLRERAVRHLVLVPPQEGVLVRALTMGFLPALGARHDYLVTSDLDAARAWLSAAEARARLQEVRDLVTARRAAGRELARVRDAIHAALPDVTLERVAAQLALSARTLQRVLARGGTTFKAEVLAAQIAVAKRALAESDDKIEAIARRVGIQSSSHFGVVFRRLVGVSPKAFRARLP